MSSFQFISPSQMCRAQILSLLIHQLYHFLECHSPKDTKINPRLTSICLVYFGVSEGRESGFTITKGSNDISRTQRWDISTYDLDSPLILSRATNWLWSLYKCMRVWSTLIMNLLHRKVLILLKKSLSWASLYRINPLIAFEQSQTQAHLKYALFYW